MTTYRFRAECLHDVTSFLANSIRKIGFQKYTFSQEGPFPDVEVELEADMGLEDLRMELRKIEDGHVMVQTINLKDQYTGERNYSL
jgi:hypothetical protein